MGQRAVFSAFFLQILAVRTLCEYNVSVGFVVSQGRDISQLATPSICQRSATYWQNHQVEGLVPVKGRAGSIPVSGI